MTSTEFRDWIAIVAMICVPILTVLHSSIRNTLNDIRKQLVSTSERLVALETETENLKRLDDERYQLLRQLITPHGGPSHA